MDAADEVSFGATFLKLRNVFNLRGDKADVRQAMQAYFRVLRGYPLAMVEAGAEAWLTRGERFPKPAEWLGAIPRQSASAGLLTMPDDEAAEYQRAASLFYEDEPCGCHLCKQAGVSHRMLRFVPEQDRDGGDAKMKIGDKVVVRGHWAHGEELKRWYAARDAFLALKAKVWPKPMPSVKLELVGVDGGAVGDAQN